MQKTIGRYLVGELCRKCGRPTGEPDGAPVKCLWCRRRKRPRNAQERLRRNHKRAKRCELTFDRARELALRDGLRLERLGEHVFELSMEGVTWRLETRPDRDRGRVTASRPGRFLARLPLRWTLVDCVRSAVQLRERINQRGADRRGD